MRSIRCAALKPCALRSSSTGRSANRASGWSARMCRAACSTTRSRPIPATFRRWSTKEMKMTLAAAELDAPSVDLVALFRESAVGDVLAELDRDLVGLTPVKARIREIAAQLL